MLFNADKCKVMIKLIEGVQRRATKLVSGMKELNYNDRLKQLGLPRLEGRRMRSDLIETFKTVNRKYDINPELFFQLDEGDRRAVSYTHLTLPTILRV